LKYTSLGSGPQHETEIDLTIHLEENNLLYLASGERGITTDYADLSCEEIRLVQKQVPNDASLGNVPLWRTEAKKRALAAFSKVLIREKQHKCESRKSARSVGG
jgi:hypothetical protein